MPAIAELQAPPEVLAALQHDGRPAGQWIRARCPFCDPEGRKGRSLAASARGFGRLRDKPGWKCFRCQAEERSRADRLATMRLTYDPNAIRDADRQRTALAIRMAEESYAIEPGCPVDLYLRDRGLRPLTATWPNSLRRALLRHPETRRRYPAMLALVTDVGGMTIAVHRTFLTDAGKKADVAEVKMSLGPCRGGAVRLGIDSETIAIAEGIESAIGAGMATGVVPWAGLSSGNMVRVNIPRHVKYVIICPDNDKNGAGDDAAQKLRARIKQLQVTQNRVIDFDIRTPPRGRADFADFG